MANYLNRRDQNIHLVFKRMCPIEHQDLLFKWFQGENECLLGLPTMITNSFENPITKNLETFFLSFFCTDFMIMTFIPLFRNVNKIHNDKGVQNKFIHFMQMLTSKQSLHFSKSAFTNENIHNKNCP